MWPRRTYTQLCWQPKSPSYNNLLLIFRVNLAGRTASGLLDTWIGGPTGVVREMMKASGGFGTRWMTDLINNIVKED